MAIVYTHQPHEPWNKGKLIGQKAPLKLKDIWAIRIRLQLGHKVRDLALFNLAIDS
ncbi:integrase [Stenotrophomonas sp. S4]